MMSIGRRLWVVLVLLAVACTTAEESPPPATGSARPAPPDQEDQAAWAVAALDPCALVARVATGPGEEVSPRTCDGTLGDGRSLRVEVGHWLNHDDRVRGIRETHGGLVSYRTFLAGNAANASMCQIAIPLSFTRAVWLRTLPAESVTVDRQCQAVADAADTVAELIRTEPATVRKSSPPTSPASWNMCALRDAALGPPPEDLRSTPGAGEATPDQCFGSSVGPDLGLMLTTGADPATTMAGEPGAQRVQLDDGVTAIGSCSLAWAQERLPDGSARVLTLNGSSAACATADQANEIRATLRSTPPLPPAPDRLGYTPDQADDPNPPVCRIDLAVPADCRPPEDVAVPENPEEIFRTAEKDGQDIACTMLAAALEEVTGREPMVAHSELECFAAPQDLDFVATLAVNPYAPTALSPEAPTTTVAGYPAVAVGNDDSGRAMDISPYGDVNKPGNLRLGVYLRPPPGSLDTFPPADPSRLAVLDGIAAYLLSTYFS